MIDAEAAASAACKALQSLRGPGHDAALAAAETARPDRAIFVRRLDQPDRSYFLVPWRSGQGVVLVVQVDASDGAMRSVAVLPTPADHLVMPKEQARSLVSAAGSKPTGDPELVWRPCRESASPLQPLYRVPTGGGGAAYVSGDGSVYDRLTLMEKGG